VAIVKIKAREVLLLLAPVVALSVMAWSFSPRASSTQSGNHALKVDSIKMERATPREVYEGYDTRLLVQFKAPPLSGKPGQGQSSLGFVHVEGAHFALSRNGSWKPVFSAGGTAGSKRIQYVETVNNRQLIYRLRMHDLTTTKEHPFLRGNLTGDIWFTSPVGTRRIRTKPSPISVKVRGANQKVRLIPTSRWRPFRFVSSEVTRVSHQEARDFEDTRLRLLFEKTVDKSVVSHNDFITRCKWIDARLEDANGVRLKWRPGSGGRMGRSNPTALKYDQNTEKGTYAFDVGITMWRVLPKTGSVIFKGALSYNDGWPLPVEVVVRKS
jgi:hypothetical protein